MEWTIYPASDKTSTIWCPIKPLPPMTNAWRLACFIKSTFLASFGRSDPITITARFFPPDAANNCECHADISCALNNPNAPPAAGSQHSFCAGLWTQIMLLFFCSNTQMKRTQAKAPSSKRFPRGPNFARLANGPCRKFGDKTPCFSHRCDTSAIPMPNRHAILSIGKGFR